LVFFSFVILVAIVINFFVFLPYVSILFLALVFAILFDPLYRFVLNIFGGRGTLASLITVVVVFLVIVGPISFLGTLLFQEASDLYVTLVASGNGGVNQSIGAIHKSIQSISPGTNTALLEGDIQLYLEKGLGWLLGHFSVFFSGILKITFGLFLMLLALFYFFRDGRTFISNIVDLSPLQDVYDKKIINRVMVAINSVVRGHLVIGIVQGSLVGLGFFLFGVPSPVIWGTIAAVASLVPTIGTSLVVIPGIIFVFISGGPLMALGLGLWGAIAVGLIDNLLGPMLINRGTHIHPFLILISALGGLAMFGPIGFLAGPVLLSLLFALLDIYPVIMRGRNPKRGKSSRSSRPI